MAHPPAQLDQLTEEESILSGYLADQAALHGILAKIRDLNLKLISVAHGSPPGEPWPT